MTAPNDNLSYAGETDTDRRRGILAENALSVGLVSAFAGDRALTQAEQYRLSDLKKHRGLSFFSDILYTVTHQYFSPEVAEDLWGEILLHKYELSRILGRNVGITVATLDYISNITESMTSATLVSEAHIEEIVGQSLRDGLTSLFNHTYFYQQIDFEVRRYLRYGTHVTLALIDIDDFKVVNDTFGHRKGDRVLAEMGKKLLHLARDSDVCCRYGGEEFAVILPLTDIYEAEAIVDRMRVNLAERLPDGRMVTVSIGVASCGGKVKTYQGLVENADTALYQVKISGKNKVLTAQFTP